MRTGYLKRVLLAASLVAAVACNADPTTSPSPSSPAETTPAGPSPAPSPPASPSDTAPDAPPPPPPPAASPCPPGETIEGGADSDAQLVDVRIGTHDGYDRLVFELEPTEHGAGPDVMPRYFLEETDEIHNDPTGDPVEVEGDVLYHLNVWGASAVDLSGETFVITYDGPNEFKPGFEMLVEVESAGDFERTMQWGIGLREERCIQVRTFTNPLRLVLDFPH